MTRRISASAYQRILADADTADGCWHFRVVRHGTGRWLPFLSFGEFVFPLPGRWALIYVPQGMPRDGQLARGVFRKLILESEVWELAIWGVAGLTRPEADYLDRIEFAEADRS